jgi:DNA-binding CsgD family transcriptional regulator
LASADRVAFRHPLARSAVYRAASPGARRPVHGALAAATDPLIDPERRAWHRAQATLGPDECIAAELERLAGRAKARGGYAAAGAFLERSAELTLDREPRSGRTIAAAEAKYTAGTFDVAQRLAAAAEACPLDDLQRARLDLLHARIAFKSGRWRGSDVPSLFLTAARNFERVELPLAREIYLEALSAALVKAGTSDAERRGAGQALTMIQWAAAVLYNSLGRYDEALVVARQAGDGLLAHCFVGLSIVEEVEAATRSGQPEAAAAALSRFAEHARACGTDWALGVEARSRALVGRGDAAEHGYRQAIERLGRTPVKLDLARAQLLYGEWLRRQQRRRDARDQLRAACECFDSIGAAAFAERARSELHATGVLARKRTFAPRETLSPQETLIARLAGDGASNRQIAGQLFISPATVAYHLRKVFTKLGVSSRRELAAALPAQPTPIPPATPHG